MDLLLINYAILAKKAAHFAPPSSRSLGSPPESKLVSNTSTVYQLYTESLSSPNPFSEKGFLVV